MRGRLLVASPLLRDPNFERSVILVLDDAGGRVVGVVLNRPGDGAVAGLPGLPGLSGLSGWERYVAEPAGVFAGGPVATPDPIGLAVVADPLAGDVPPGWAPLAGRLGRLDLRSGARATEPAVEAVRVLTGSAAWRSDQLAGEIALGAWVLVDADPGDAVTRHPEALWAAVVRRQAGWTSALAHYPKHPRQN